MALRRSVVRPFPSAAAAVAALAAALTLALAPALGLPLRAAEPEPPRPVVSRAGAYVRTLTAVVTDAKGRPLARPLSLDDLEVLEDGVPATLLAVEPVRPSVREAAPAAARGRAEPAAPKRRRVHQTLYVDTALMRLTSVKAVAGAVKAALPAILTAGPLEVVVADPSPKVWTAATEDAAALAASLTRLAVEVTGRDVVGRLRREVADARRAASNKATFGQSAAFGELGTTLRTDTSAGGDPDAPPGDPRLRVQEFAAQEASLVSLSLGRLRAFTVSRPEIDFGILYLGTDGFDVDQALFYAPTGRGLARSQAFDRIPAMVKECADALLARGWVAVPIGLGAVSQAPVGRLAEDGPVVAVADEREGGTPLMVRPVDPLRSFAEATGGEVVVSARKLPATLAGLSKAWAVSYQVATPPDGKSHAVTIRSRRRGVVVRAAESITAGTPEAAAALRALHVLSGEETSSEVPVAVALEKGEPAPDGRLRGQLTTRVTLSSLREVLARLGGGRLRLTVLAEVPGQETTPHHEEVAVPATGFADVWALKTPILLPREAARVAVVVEELSTGLWGAGTAVPGEGAGAAAAASISPGGRAPAEDAGPPSTAMEILTFAAGLVTGTVPVRADLGPADSAELLLDGTLVCTLTRQAPSCPVPLGEELTVHRLDLVRRDGANAEAERVTRWLNRPGSSAAVLRSSLSCGEPGAGGSAEASAGASAGALAGASPSCLLRISWIHPDRLEPFTWSVSLDGVPVSTKPERGYRLLLPGDGKRHVITAAARFADGAEASLTRVVGEERLESAGDTLQAVPFEILAAGPEPTPEGIGERLGVPVRLVERGEAGTIVVLDPTASKSLFDQDLEAEGKSFPGISKHKLMNVLKSLGAMSVVHPLSTLARFLTVPALHAGDARLDLLLYGPPEAPSGRFLLADAVAAAGSLAAGSHRRRAVVVILGDEQADRSRFSPAAVRAYLSELMVPLVVLRTGEAKPGPWGEEVPVLSRDDLRKALAGVSARLESQRVAWVAEDAPPGRLSLADPSGRLRLAGRR